jgi:hypothetical protein
MARRRREDYFIDPAEVALQAAVLKHWKMLGVEASMALDVRDRMVLLEARPALRRIGRGWTFERAKSFGPRFAPKPRFHGARVKALVDGGLLRWVNASRSAAVLTEEGRKARDDGRPR